MDQSTVKLISKQAQTKVALASTSDIKREAVEACIKPYQNINLVCVPVTDPNQIEQPFQSEGGLDMARNRIQWILKQHPHQFNAIIAIENFIRPNDTTAEDVAIVVIYLVNEQLEYVSHSQCIELPDMELFNELKTNYLLPTADQNDSLAYLQGLTKTYGQLYHEHHPEVPANNWMKYTSDVDRIDQLKTSIQTLIEQVVKDQAMIKQVRDQFTFHSDFPTKGVGFLDWSNLFTDLNLVDRLTSYLACKYQHCDPPIRYVAGLDSRGIWLAIPLADKLRTMFNNQVSFIPIRKPGKLPEPKHSKSYTKEYGEDTLEMRSDLEAGPILIVDDILATGGSLQAAAELAQLSGHQIVDCIVLRDVKSLRPQTRAKLGDLPIRIVIYDEEK